MAQFVQDKKPIVIHWFRRDLRLEDNAGLYHASEHGAEVLPVFIFDSNIIDELPSNDPRLNFIYDTLKQIHNKLILRNSGIRIYHGDPMKVWHEILSEYPVKEVFFNKDYEPYGIKRDQNISGFLKKHGIKTHSYKDQVIFEEGEILKKDQKPYTVFTPYKNKWIQKFEESKMQSLPLKNMHAFYEHSSRFPEKSELGIKESSVYVKDFNLSAIAEYAEKRDFPFQDAGTYLGPHLRFGTIGIRNLIGRIGRKYEIFLSELIWREFFMQILYHYPSVVDENFKKQYNHVAWRNNEKEFECWCHGKTGYPLVDAGMRELNETGYMHNRVRMLTASFLCKHLLTDWKWGEAYFAEKLLDYELSSNNGNWQWAAGTGCDAAPYFRVFNPDRQMVKFDKDMKYIEKWLPEYKNNTYPKPIVDHPFARERALNQYKKGLIKSTF